MLKLGDYQTLRIKKRTDYGLYLDGGDEGNILLPNRYVTRDMRIGDEIEVFIYLDQDERTIATTEHPIAKVGEFAWLECAWTNEYGAFLNWGLMKDLFCPFREQKQRMERGKKYYVYIMEDEKTHRLMATAKVERYQKKTAHELALDFSEQLLRYLYENDNKDLQAGLNHLKHYSLEEAIESFTAAQTTKNKLTKAYAVANLAVVLELKGEPKQAREQAEKAVSLFIKLKSAWGRQQAINQQVYVNELKTIYRL